MKTARNARSSVPRVEIWTDGFFVPNGRVGGWAFLISARGEISRTNLLATGFEDVSHEAIDQLLMEQIALTKALRALKRKCIIQIYPTNNEFMNSLHRYRSNNKVRHAELSKLIKSKVFSLGSSDIS